MFAAGIVALDVIVIWIILVEWCRPGPRAAHKKSYPWGQFPVRFK